MRGATALMVLIASMGTAMASPLVTIGVRDNIPDGFYGTVSPNGPGFGGGITDTTVVFSNWPIHLWTSANGAESGFAHSGDLLDTALITSGGRWPLTVYVTLQNIDLSGLMSFDIGEVTNGSPRATIAAYVDTANGLFTTDTPIGYGDYSLSGPFSITEVISTDRIANSYFSITADVAPLPDPPAVPEPSPLAVLASGLLVIGLIRRVAK